MDRVSWKSSHIQQKIAEKRAELEHLNEIKRNSGILTGQLETLSSKLNDIADGTEAVALVLSNWQNVVSAVSLASLGLYKYGQKDYETGTPLPEYLVRIKLEKDDAPEIQESEEEEDVGEDAEENIEIQSDKE
ncbi:DASH complex subunit Dad2p [[Candida] railenensis]|uniref:DASH complex subunit DAD2 n=1 Tax=[Candida] railenensis TaxID=45579 RepID=A0A9P0QQ19_9ASCO|nr:DASH complex subunit Dad2p [[Candida] railenensis]